MKVLGIDPGVGRLGWAIVKKSSTAEKLIDCGCLETPANSPLPSRLKQIHLFLTDLIKEHQPHSYINTLVHSPDNYISRRQQQKNPNWVNPLGFKPKNTPITPGCSNCSKF